MGSSATTPLECVTASRLASLHRQDRQPPRSGCGRGTQSRAVPLDGAVRTGFHAPKRGHEQDIGEQDAEALQAATSVKLIILAGRTLLQVVEEASDADQRRSATNLEADHIAVMM